MKLKVLYIVNSTTSTGGATKSLLTLLDAAVKVGIDPLVVLPDDNGLAQILKERDIKTYVTPYYVDIYPSKDSTYHKIVFLPLLVRTMFYHHRAVKNIKKIAKNWRPDIIHTNTSVVSIGFEVARSLNIPHIYHIREYADLDFNMHYIPNKKRFINALQQHNSYSICITKDIQRHHGQTENGNSKVIYNGIAPLLLKELPTSERKHQLLYAGRIESSKGVYEMVQAYLHYEATSKNPMTLLLIGETSDKSYKQSIKKLIAQSGCGSKSIIWHDPVTNIDDFMRQAKAIVICSPSEAFGRCMPEAMLNGCLAIGHNTGGTKEQLDNGVATTGAEIALRYDSTEQLTSLFHQVETMTESDIIPYRQRAFRTVCELYSNEHYTTTIINTYKQIIK